MKSSLWDDYGDDFTILHLSKFFAKRYCHLNIYTWRFLIVQHLDEYVIIIRTMRKDSF